MSKKVVFLVSGGGGNLKYIYRAKEIFQRHFEIIAVIGDRVSGAIEFARENSIYHHVIQYSKDKPKILNDLLFELRPDIVVTNIHKILDLSTINSCNARFINLHYSLLPGFKGLIGMKTVQEAKRINCQFIGATVHIVSEELDGGSIICQASFHPNWNDEIEKIYDTVFQAGCILLLSVILDSEIILEHVSTHRYMIINSNEVYFSVSTINAELHHSLYLEVKN